MMIRKRSSTLSMVVAGISILLVAGVSAGFIMLPDTDVFFRINKSIDVFGRVYKEVAANYVDTIDPEKFMLAGIEGMLGTLDPYTVYIGEEDGEEVDLLTDGKYGGIGVTIGVRDGVVRVISVMDGYSAQRVGLVPGDVFLKVDSVPVESKRPNEVKHLTRGEPGTEVRLLIEREGAPEPLEFVLIREEIRLKNVTYAGYAEPGIGYVRLERFSRQAGEEVRRAIQQLESEGVLKGLILDLRGNPGGLLDAAVDVASKFVPRGSVVVSTRGRRDESKKSYRSVEEPLVPATPVVVLTDRSSASASEIVAGSLQDLDRALIVGTRTFGKGLVQTIIPLSFGAQLKITTARYYTPSGRCIQEIDYITQDRTGVFGGVRDSLTREFTTLSGRPVYEHGGIMPDSVVDHTDYGPLVRELNRKSMFFKFINQYLAIEREDTVSGVSPDMLNAFMKYLEETEFSYQEESEGKIQDLLAIAERAHYCEEVVEEINSLKLALMSEKERGFDRYKNHIADGLRVELMSRLSGERGRIEASFPSDTQMTVAVSLLKDPALYKTKLGG
jgi:carboxyl-terminal processing protease